MSRFDGPFFEEENKIIPNYSEAQKKKNKIKQNAKMLFIKVIMIKNKDKPKYISMSLLYLTRSRLVYLRRCYPDFSSELSYFFLRESVISVSDLSKRLKKRVTRYSF